MTVEIVVDKLLLRLLDETTDDEDADVVETAPPTGWPRGSTAPLCVKGGIPYTLSEQNKTINLLQYNTMQYITIKSTTKYYD